MEQQTEHGIEQENQQTSQLPETKKYEKKTGEWYFEDEDDKTLGVETFDYENGGKSKRCKLSDGRIAVVHRLKGKDNHMINRIVGKDKDNVQAAVAARATKIDDKGIVLEDLEEMWYPDYTKIVNLSSSINFM